MLQRPLQAPRRHFASAPYWILVHEKMAIKKLAENVLMMQDEYIRDLVFLNLNDRGSE